MEPICFRFDKIRFAYRKVANVPFVGTDPKEDNGGCAL